MLFQIGIMLKVLLLFQFGIMLKTKNKTVFSYLDAPTDPRPASTVTVQANNLSHSMQIANAG